MKFTSEMLIKDMGLSIGDKIKVTFKDDTIEEYEIIKYDNGNIILHDDFHGYDDHVGYLLDNEIEILPRPKRVGDTLCKDCECEECHLRCLPHCNQLNNGKKTLFNILDGWNEYNSFDQEIYDLLKARLDKVVE